MPLFNVKTNGTITGKMPENLLLLILNKKAPKEMVLYRHCHKNKDFLNMQRAIGTQSLLREASHHHVDDVWK